jgi:predicted transcriptional regulator
MRITTIMNRKFSRIRPDADFKTVLRAMRSMPSRNLYVVDGQDVLLGVISSYDVLNVMLPFYLDANLAKALDIDEEFLARTLEENKQLSAKDLMIADFASMREDGHFLEAEARIKERALNALAVVDEAGRIVGEVTRKRILATLLELSDKTNADAGSR